MKTKTKTWNTYKFNELTPDQQQKALERYSDINVDHEWWDYLYDDARSVGIKLTGFDIYHQTIEGEFINGALNCIDKVIKEHGEKCETYKTAHKYLPELNRIEKLENEEEYSPALQEKKEDTEHEFLQDILEDYLQMLRKECEYLQSKESIVETFKANDYDFDEEGKIS